MMPDRERARQRLMARLVELNVRVCFIENEQRQPLDDDFAEQAVAREDDETMDAVERSALAEITLTRQALARLDSGDYGRCVSCGEAIAPARLEAMPAASNCIHAQAELRLAATEGALFPRGALISYWSSSSATAAGMFLMPAMIMVHEKMH